MRAYVVLCLLLAILAASNGVSMPALTLDPTGEKQYLESYFVNLPYAKVVEEAGGSPPPALVQTYRATGLKESLWFKFSVFNPTAEPRQRVLSVGFPLYTLIAIEAASMQEVARTGASVPRENKIVALTPAIFITFPPGKSTYYLAVNTDGNPFIPQFVLYAPETFFADLRSNIILFALFAGAVLTISLYLLLFSIFIRDIQLASFTIAGVSYVLLEATISGFPLLFEPPYSYRLGNTWLLWDAACMIGVTVLTRRIFNVKENYPRLNLLMYGFLAMSFVIPPVFQLHAMIFAGTYIAMESLALGLFILIALIELFKKNTMALAYLLSFLPVFLVSTFFILQLAGLFPAHLSLNKLRFSTAILWALMLATGLMMLADKLRASHHNLRTTLTGLISVKQIERLISQGGELSRAPTKKYITVMFIDIVGYSRTIRDLSPIEGFTSLREILNEITSTIHKYDGIIDRSLGDGMLCFFGHGLLGVGSDDHEHRAFLSAVEIQQNSIKRVIDAGEKLNHALFPLRIAIHSATVCIGNLGEENRFEIALAGEGVFMAEKLEAVCEPHKIVVSRSAFDALPEMIRNSGGFSERFFPLTSRERLQAGLEFDPFYDESEILAKAVRVYQNIANRKQRHPRFAVKRGSMHVESNHGTMEIVNFSHGGFCLRANVYLGRGTQFDLQLTPFAESEEIKFINPVIVEVLWAIIENQDSFLFGVRMPHLNDKQKEIILRVLQEENLDQSASA